MTGDGGKAAELAKLTRSRGILRARITKLQTNFSTNCDHWGASEISMHLLKAKNLYDEIIGFDKDIMSLQIDLDTSEDDLVTSSDSNEHYTDLLLNIISKLENPTIADNTTPGLYPAQNQNFSFHSPNPSTGLKLPPVELPKYGNKKGDNLGKFFKIFDSIIDKQPQLSEHQQFLLLQQQLSGPPPVFW